VLYAVVGEGEERESLARLAAETGVAGQVQFLGEVDDATTLDCYRQCDLFALPNRQVGRDIEGFGIVLLEAQACGKPVLAGASGGTAETMRVGETGVVVPCESPDPLGEALVELLLDPLRRERMGQAGRQWAGRFDWSRLANEAAVLFGVEAVKDSGEHLASVLSGEQKEA
jgi:phosphatidylinositol alpha-1,6-mannosyltransferase